MAASRLVPVPVRALAGTHHDTAVACGRAREDEEEEAVVGFASHVEYELPVSGGDGEGEGGDEGGDGDGDRRKVASGGRSLHVMRLTPRWAARVQRELLPRALENARRGYDALQRLEAGKDGGVVVSNVGGYQSAHDILDPATWSDSDDDDDDCHDDEDRVGVVEEPATHLPKAAGSLRGWALLSAVVCAAHERVRDPTLGDRPITRDDLYGWLNSNAAGDYNKLHDHGGAESWSGVYYLQCPPPAVPPPSDSDDSASDEDVDGAEYGAGALGLRRHERSSSVDPAAPPPGRAVPYLRFNPAAGDLIMFRGDVLHAVESNGWAKAGGYAGEAADMDLDALRLSFAFNEDSRASDRKAESGSGGVSR